MVDLVDVPPSREAPHPTHPVASSSFLIGSNQFPRMPSPLIIMGSQYKLLWLSYHIQNKETWGYGDAPKMLNELH